jgi:hypothetical protein
MIPIALLGWIPLTISLFIFLPPQRAAVASLVGGWLLLPPASLPVSGLPDYDKLFAASLGILLGTLIFQPNRLLELRLRWFDIPVICWCMAPFIASNSNGLGLYDACAALLTSLARWGLPYLIGRLYFGEPDNLRELAIGMVIGGLAYIPPILIEIKMSPFFKDAVYGIHQWEGSRYGAYRPWVFLSKGLELGMWMTAVSLTATWLWRSRAIQRIGTLSFGSFCLPALLVTTVLCRSIGALLLLLVGLGLLWFSTRINKKWFVYLLLLVAPTYYALRIPNIWSGDNVVSLIRSVDATRAHSLEYRFQCENHLIRRAMQRPAFGWGGWGRNRVIEKGKDIAPTDGMWIINLGTTGLFGLISWTTFLTLPAWLFLRKFPVRDWRSPSIAPMTALVMLLGLYMVDCLVNAFINLIYIVCCGGLASAIPVAARRLASARQAELWGAHVPTGSDRDGASSLHRGGASASSLPIPEERLASRYERLARTLRDSGAPAEARSAWGMALDLLHQLAAAYPERPDIARKYWDCANDMAWFLLTHSDPGVSDPSLAWHLASQTTEADPQCPAYWNTLGVASYRLGDASAAVAALERAISLSDGGTAFDHLFLARSYAQLGDAAQAQYWTEQMDRWVDEHPLYVEEITRLQMEEHAFPAPLPDARLISPSSNPQ